MNKDPSSFKLMVQYLLDAEFQASQPLDSVRVLSALLLTFVLASLIVVIYRICHRQVVTRAGSATAMVLVSMVSRPVRNGCCPRINAARPAVQLC